MSTTYTKLVSLTTSLLMERSYNSLSFADLSEQVGITKAAIHYHFPAKEDLALETVKNYSEMLQQELQHCDAHCKTAFEKLEAIVNFYESLVENGKACLCAILYSDFDTLPEAVMAAAKTLKSDMCGRFERSFVEGAEDGSLSFEGSASDHAKLLYTTLQGVLLIARPNRDVTFFRGVSASLLQTYRPTAAG